MMAPWIAARQHPRFEFRIAVLARRDDEVVEGHLLLKARFGALWVWQRLDGPVS
jgi:hypothetical protein